MNHLQNEFIWVEKYRPQNIEECVLPERVKSVLRGIIEKNEMQHLMFCATPGNGKTTAAKALARDLGVDVMIINASEENGIDVLRTKIRSYASTVSFSGDFKIVILDEADYLTPQVQAALRGFMEEFSGNCRFILTCNFKNRLIEALHSRCTAIEFNPTREELPEMSGKFMKRLKKILSNENIPTNDKALAEIIKRFAPDWRRVLNECQKAAIGSKEINTGALVSLSEDSVGILCGYLKDKNFREMRRWVVENMDLDATAILRKVYDNLYTYVQPASIPQAVLIIADYSYKNAFVADREINLVAALTDLMANIEFL